MGKFDKLKSTGPRISAKTEIESVTRLIDEVKETSENKDIAISRILFNPDNDYAKSDTEQSIADFAQVISEQGLLHNLVVSARPPESSGREEYILLSGERRLKAIRLLDSDPNQPKGKWSHVRCLILRELTPRQEMIFLDAANLETRGGIGDEQYTRKVVTRYIDNLQAEYGISEAAAKGMAVRLGMNRRTVDRMVTIEKKSDPQLRDLLDAGKMTKVEVLSISALDGDIYDTVVKTVKNLYDRESQPGVMEAITRFRNDLALHISSNNFIERDTALQKICNNAEDTILQLEQAAETPLDTDEGDRGGETLDVVEVQQKRYMSKCDKMLIQANRMTGNTARKHFATMNEKQREEIAKRFDDIIRTLTFVRDSLQ